MSIIENLLLDFLNHCKYEKNLDPKTISAYKNDLEFFTNFLHRFREPYPVEELKKENIKEYVEALSDFKPKTIKRKLASTKAFLNHIEYENEDFRNPFHKLKIKIKEPFVLPEVMLFEEIKKILEFGYSYLIKADRQKYQYQERLRNITILELLFATGIRVSELCTLKIQNINLNSGFIVVNGKGKKERKIQICNKDVLKVLGLYNDVNKKTIKSTGYFFTNRIFRPISDQSVRIMVKKYAHKAKIERNITPHVFRHSFATLLLEQDVDIKYIQHLLGHSNITTTTIYTHVNSIKQKEILAKKHPREGFKIEFLF